MKSKAGERILEFFIILSIISIIINSLIYFLYKNELNVYIMLFSLFLIGVLTLILIFKYGKHDINIDDYIILDRVEYESLKNKVYNQNIKLKKQDKIINTIKTIIK